MPRSPKDFAGLLPHGLMLDNKAGWVLLSTPKPWWLSARLDLGCAWEVTPRNIEACPEGVCLETASLHASMLRALPVGSQLQVISLRQPSQHIPAWEAARPSTSPLVHAQLEHIHRGMPYGRGRSGGRLYTSQTLVTLRMPLPSLRQMPAQDVEQAVLSADDVAHSAIFSALSRRFAPAIREAFVHRQMMEDSLAQAGHGVRSMTGEEIGQAVARAIDPHLPSLPSISPVHPLREQVLTQEALAHGGGWTYGDHGATLLTLHRLPPKTSPGILNAPRAPEGSEPLALWDIWDDAMALVMNITIQDQPGLVASLKRRRMVAWKHRLKIFGATDPENAQVEAELEQLIGAVFGSLECLYPTRTHVVLYGATAALSRGAELLRSRASLIGLELLPETTLGNSLFLQTLPLGFDFTWPQEGFLNRARLIPGKNLGQLLPLYSASRGTGTPHILYLNRCGEPMTFAPFEDGIAQHGLVSGKIGSGKSYGMAHFVNQVLPLGAKVIILDQLPSYKELCAAHGGTYYEMDFNTPICFNAFFGPLDTEHQAFATAAIAEMASSNRDPLSQEHLGVLADAVGYFTTHWDRERGEPRLGIFHEEVLATGRFSPQDRRAQRLAMEIARRLGPFVGHGHLAGFVDGPNTFRIDNNLTVIELSKLSEFKDLQGIILFATLHLLTQFFQDPLQREIWKYFIGDETWAVLKNEATAGVLEQMSRTYRKLLVSAWFLSQQATDFSSQVGQVILKNADIKLFFAQDPGEITQMRTIFELNDAELAMIRQARRHPGWSSAYLKLPQDQGGLIHLVPDAGTDWFAGQTSAHRAARAQAQRETGQPLLEAFMAMQEVPHA